MEALNNLAALARESVPTEDSTVEESGERLTWFGSRLA